MKNEINKIIITRFPYFYFLKLLLLFIYSRCTSKDDFLGFCDRYIDKDETGNPQFFFDRNWGGFASILDVYRMGSLHLDVNVCALLTHRGNLLRLVYLFNRNLVVVFN